MRQTDWKIIYTKYEGIAKKAINFLSKEAGKYLIREEGLYKTHVLACEKEGCQVTKNAFFVSLYNDSPTIQKFVKADEIKNGGFLVKVVANPDDSEGRYVLITANDNQELFYGAVSFIDDYVTENTPQTPANLFDSPIPEYCYTESADNETRSIFTWGHSFSDYRKYIDDMARLKFNELILWNDYLPLNITDIIEYAHSYGIRVVLGYSWGWKEVSKNAESITEETIEEVKQMAIRDYREIYASIKCDGIYFQTFTERAEDKIGDKLIARVVTDLVNEVAAELWNITPDLRLIFGLHASSVRNHLDEIARVDSRIEILWEDCGEFPYSYIPYVVDEKEYEKTLDFTKDILTLRGGENVGLVFKGVMMLNWFAFIHQAGPYVMGENASYISDHDKQVRADSWRRFSAHWMQYGDDAFKVAEFVKANKKGKVNMCLAGTLDGGIYLPYALCGQMFRSLDSTYGDTLKRVAARGCITVD